MSSNWRRFLAKGKGKTPATQKEAKTNGRPFNLNEAAKLEKATRRRRSRSSSPDGSADHCSKFHPTIARVQAPLTKHLAMDCEMVGVGLKDRSALAQVCIVNSNEEIVYLTYVQTKEQVADFRTWVSGVRPEHLEKAPSFATVQKEVAELTQGRILVGHGLTNDLKALMMKHEAHLIRDTTKYPPFCILRRGKRRPRRLKHLAEQILGMEIQTGEHSPAEDAIAPMRLYKLVRKDWERWLRNRTIVPPEVKPLPSAATLQERKKDAKKQKEEAGVAAPSGAPAAGPPTRNGTLAVGSTDPLASRRGKRPREDNSNGRPAAPAKKARLFREKVHAESIVQVRHHLVSASAAFVRGREHEAVRVEAEGVDC